VDPSAPFPRPLTAPNAFSVMTKPTGAICNLDCKYCYFLEKEALYPGSNFHMDYSTTEIYIKQLLESQNGNECTLVWQGGEPTLMGLDFFKTVLNLVERYRPQNMRVFHSIQTNGTLLDEDWCEFFAENQFLVGISIDGPATLHDSYRVNKSGKQTHSQVVKAIKLLKQHNVEFNLLAVVSKSNQDYPLDVYRHFRDELDATYIQFIPLVETRNAILTERSVNSRKWGDFLIQVYDEWLSRDVGKVFIQIFEVALGIWLGKPSSLCIFAEECGNGLALEHNGDLYSCDHFVEPKHLIGNIKERHILELVSSDKQRAFGKNKRTSLPSQCINCEVKFACNGECPKNRIISTTDGQAGLNYLCDGYRRFFNYIDPSMKQMVDLLVSGKFVDEIMVNKS
jgi:uncharacterized protein